MATNIEHFDLTGKRCLVFGADRPPGAAIAEALEEAGGAVAHIDVVPAPAVKETVKTGIETLDGIDVLVWASDLFLAKPFTEVEPGDIGEVMMGNFASAFSATQGAVETMLEQGRGGNVVLVTHVLGERGLPNTSVYGAAHGALQNFIRSLAQEVAPSGISVNGIALGWMEWMTDRLDAADPEAARAIRFTMAKRAGAPEDIGAMAVWLAGSGVGFVTGQTFPVDGGLTQHL